VETIICNLTSEEFKKDAVKYYYYTKKWPPDMTGGRILAYSLPHKTIVF